MIATMLEKSDFQVAQITNGREVWDLLSAHKSYYVEEQRPLYNYVGVVVSDI